MRDTAVSKAEMLIRAVLTPITDPGPVCVCVLVCVSVSVVCVCVCACVYLCLCYVVFVLDVELVNDTSDYATIDSFLIIQVHGSFSTRAWILLPPTFPPPPRF